MLLAVALTCEQIAANLVAKVPTDELVAMIGASPSPPGTGECLAEKKVPTEVLRAATRREGTREGDGASCAEIMNMVEVEVPAAIVAQTIRDMGVPSAHTAPCLAALDAPAPVVAAATASPRTPPATPRP
ncbi:MAG: hypothetical protein ACOZNI_18915 [Myxococcota bacterium]